MVQSSIELYLETGTNMGHLKPDSGTISFNGERKESPAKNFRGALACMVNSEIGAVLAVMRRNVRWGVRYVADDDKLEHSLIHSLKELRKKIFSWQNKWHNVDPAVYLQPFLDVIQSDETGAPITGVALSSVYKILSLDILNLDTVNVGDAMHLIVDAVTSCRFEVTDPASEEVVLMKILQVLLACMKSTASVRLSNQHVCNIVNTCFRVVHQASSKGELLQRIARHTMHELVRCIFSHLPDIDSTEHALANGNSSCVNKEVGSPEKDHTFESEQLQNGDGVEFGGQSSAYASKAPMSMSASGTSNGGTNASNGVEPIKNDEKLLMEPYGVPSMVEIFHFLCSLLNAIEHIEFGPQSNPIAYDEDVPLFALGLINSAIELGGPYIGKHPQLLAIVQDELFRNLMQYALSMSPLILSTVCSIVLNLYHHLRTELKVQLEAFLSCVLLRLAQSKHGSSYQLQEVAMEALVDLCRQHTFMAEMYANFDCDITCSNMFEDLANLLSKSAFPVNGPLSAMHILALDGLISMVQGMAERLGNEPLTSEPLQDNEGYKEFSKPTKKSEKTPQDLKHKKSTPSSQPIAVPNFPQRETAPSLLRRQDSMTASCSSDASSSTTDTSSLSGRVGVRKKQYGLKREKVESVVGGADSLMADSIGSLESRKRCAWVTPTTDPWYAAFHDEEWGFPVHDDKRLFELLSLSGALAERTWPEILNKRNMFREVFLDFDPIAVSKLNEKKFVSPGSCASSLLSEVKLRAIIENAHQISKVIIEFGSFSKYIWNFVNHKSIVSQFRYPRQVPVKTPKAEMISKDLVKRGFRSVGPTVIYTFMQVAGLTNDHLISCFRFKECMIMPEAGEKDGALKS